MAKYSGIASIIIVLTIVVSCVVGGYVSSLYLGPDNEIEDVLEEIAEHEIEKETHAPDGSLKEEVDLLFPHAKDGKKQ